MIRKYMQRVFNHNYAIALLHKDLPVSGSTRDWNILCSSVQRYGTGTAAIGPLKQYKM